MKLILLSDTHGQHNKLSIPEGDMIVHCGDFSRTGNYEDHYKFSKWLGNLPHKYKLATAGNHDRYSQQQTALTKQMFKEHGVTFLIDELIEIEGKRIYMSPWTPRYGNWYWMKDRGHSIGAKFNNIPNNLDLLATHGQPYGILDNTIYEPDGKVGCEELLKAIHNKQPKNVVGGHLHFSGGLSLEADGIKFFNASICDEDYTPTNKIHIIEI